MLLSYKVRSKIIVNSGMAFAYDDPDDDSVVQSLLINAFDGATMSHDRSHGRPHCTLIIAANRFIVD